MSQQTSTTAKERFPFPLLCLTLGAFAIGMTEFIIMGLLPNVAHDLHVSIPKAGFLITGYALGVAVGAPLLTVLTLRVPQKKLLVLLMIIFIAGNALSIVAPSFALLLAARVLTAFAHGTFLGVGSLIASRLVRPEKQAGAVSLVLAGLSIANIVGVPFGTMIGQQLGWRASFAVIVGLGIISLAGIIRFIPQIRQDEVPRLDRELKSLMNPRVLLMLGIGMFGCACLFSLFTYITPILESISGFAEHQVTYILVLFGFGITIGNLVGGRLADWKLMPSVTTGYVVLAILLVVLAIAFHHPIAAVVTVFLWGVAAFGVMPGVNFRIMDLAREAPLLAATSTHSVLNIGNAGGAYLGGLAITHLGLGQVPWVAVCLAAAGLIGCLISIAADRKANAARSAASATAIEA
ncbi:MFS transporter [Cohnella lubricantis]|uniref:MFS transporter n=1 Tax=Cohnella lubricantis TaxID=2163172 RepID=A0A841TI12_9BACL|nr:MFS transporter [Cohnella lubricantis]MBB6679785.1 MFS transporter [Cohnella lubricantis]MBP2120237.1 DHA1 family inner membrane transport protein [Cohnella lubricantis]